MLKYLRARYLAWLYRRRDRATAKALRRWLDQQARSQPMNPTLTPAARALIIEAATREAQAWTLAVAAAALAATFFALWLASLRPRSQARPTTSRARASGGAEAEASSKYLQRRRAA